MEKALPSAKAATKQSALEALLLYVEIDKAEPIMEDLLKGLGNKLPKIVASTLAAMTALYHAYGVKIVEPKPALKALPKVFGHADKNVRAEASTLAQELYRWLQEAMKPLFWDDLKDVQKSELEKLFDQVKSQAAPRQTRLQRSQQETAPEDAAAPVEEVAEPVNAFDLAEPVNVLAKLPPDFHQNMASAKWKDRKEALDALYQIANTPRIKDGGFDDVAAALTKCMKDTNVAVVSTAANCVDALAKGLQKSFAKHRSKLMPAMLDRMKERKQTVIDALGQALDAFTAISGLSDCLDDFSEFSKHKNPQVRSETAKLLIRTLTTTPHPPSDAERKLIADIAVRLMAESVEALRTNGAQILGTLMKITGERALNPSMEGLDNVRTEKVKEFFAAATVKARPKTKPPAPTASKSVAKRALPPASPAPQRSAPSKLGALPKPSLVASGLKKKPQPTPLSPSRQEDPPKQNARGLTQRPLGKPSVTSPTSTPPKASSSAAHVAEIESLRMANASLTRASEEVRQQCNKLLSQVNELQNQNAQLIEDHTRDVLSIKAKETQLVRARSDAEAAEQACQRLQRENGGLKRELADFRVSEPEPPSRIIQPSPSEEKENTEASETKPPENWKRAAEVTSQLKARIEMMKVGEHTLLGNANVQAKQGLNRAAGR